MEELNIEKFSPKKAELQIMADTAKQITLPDPLDKKQLAVVHDVRLSLRNARTGITKAGKELREEALRFQKLVIGKEKELIAIIEPEENRLGMLEDEAIAIQEREDRREFLPRRKERLAAIKDGIEISDDALLDMTGDAFEGYFNKRMADKNEAERLALAKKQSDLDKEKDEIKRKEDLRLAEERGKKEAEQREQEKKDREAQAEKEAAEKRERDAAYQAFLKENGYNKDEFYTTQDIGGVITLWKKVATFIPKQNQKVGNQ